MKTQGLLAEIAERLGRSVSEELAAALWEVLCHRFLPANVRVRDGQGGYWPIDRAADPGEWMAAAHEDQTLVGQFTDGLPSSSASMPSMAPRMLRLAKVATPARMRQQAVKGLQLGARTGFIAALLRALLGQDGVTRRSWNRFLPNRAIGT
ncbi:hypothetical protein [Streptomyces sp. NPDC001787]|uniref:hypothetical protein n=1 Tax=Streptomyces sp. NPDC001787 TaxID=3154523 RepID=UPI0033191B31